MFKKSLNDKKIIVIVAVLIFLIVIALCIRNVTLSKKETEKISFTGTYVLGSQEDDNSERFAITAPEEGKYYTYHNKGAFYESNYEKIAKSCIILYDSKNEIYAQIFCSEGDFYIVKNNEKAEMLKRISTIPTVRSNKWWEFLKQQK